MTALVLDASPVSPAPPPFGPGAPGFAEFQLGARTLHDALSLAESPAGAASAVLLLRTAVLSLLGAQLARHGEDPSSEALSAEDSWAVLRRQPATGPLLQQLTMDQGTLLQRLLARDWDATALTRLDAAARAHCLLTL